MSFLFSGSACLITQSPDMYLLEGGSIVPNLAKISAKETADLQAYEKAQELELINKRMIKQAQDSLIAEGESFKYDHGGE